MTQKKNIEIDDFIVEELMEKPAKKIDPSDKLINFANIEIAAIDPRVKKELNELIQDSKDKIEQIKNIIGVRR